MRKNYDTMTMRVPVVVHIEPDVFCAEMVKRWIEVWPEVRHGGFAATGRDGIALCREKRPAIVLLSLSLPDMNRFAVVDELRAQPVPPRILLLTRHTDDVRLFRVRTSSVAGMIWKSKRCTGQIHDGLVAAAAGNNYYPPEVRAAIRRFWSSPDAFFNLLSNREISLIDDLAHGNSDKEIAAKRGIRQETVRFHLKNAMAKLGLHRRMDLVRWAEKKGFGGGDRGEIKADRFCQANNPPFSGGKFRLQGRIESRVIDPVMKLLAPLSIRTGRLHASIVPQHWDDGAYGCHRYRSFSEVSINRRTINNK